MSTTAMTSLYTSFIIMPLLAMRVTLNMKGKEPLKWLLWTASAAVHVYAWITAESRYEAIVIGSVILVAILLLIYTNSVIEDNEKRQAARKS